MRTSSILPYLHGPERQLYLDLFPTATAVDGVAPSACYRVGALARAYKGVLRTNSGFPLKGVDVLIQEDESSFIHQPGSLPLSSGRQVDDFWQGVLSKQRDSKEEGGGYFFKEQLREGGGFIPFDPLFYCTRRKRFFSSFCPQCGKPLQLCRDDTLLGQNDLPGYGSSLNRYMFCPECAEGRNLVWYAKDRSDEGPPVHDSRRLLADMGKWAGGGREPDFPCLDCPYHERCYGEGQAVGQVVSCLSFYPFHMLLLDATECSGREYLDMVSGEAPDPGGQGFLTSPGSGRRWLEALYLRVSFLREAATGLLAQKQWDSGSTGWYVPLEFVRVGLDNRFPSCRLWNVRVVNPGLALSPDDRVLPEPPSMVYFYTLALLWFRGLCAGGERSEADIVRILTDLLKELDDRHEPVPVERLEQLFPVSGLLPSSGDIRSSSEVHTYYCDSLALGGALLAAAYGAELDDRKWLEDLSGLVDRLQSSLLHAPPAGVRQEAVKNDVILKALMSLRSRLRAEEAVIRQAGPDDATVIITPVDFTEELEETKSGRIDETAPIMEDDATVILTDQEVASSFDGFTDPAPQPVVEKVRSMPGLELEETLDLQKPQEEEPLPPAEPVHAPGGDELAETVVQAVADGGGKSEGETGPMAGKPVYPEIPEDDDLLMETVVLKPGGEKQQP